ncbi:hypothetical protein Tsubulata_036098 [Turnera subulata]|uniref:non-specific serine/threonine protein kinase n=1 Tax=Turnera subulata TaxID=218843 RepID=A0A9Q0J0C9_9ROSI|nr:hypothetical protein Tsubulata_036098 [Turnera subulata]
MGHPHRHHHRRLLLLLLLLLLILTAATADDGAVILQLAKSLTPLPPGWSTKSSAGFCNWKGIKCDSSHQRVTSISLSRMGLSGILPPGMSTLTELQSLSLQDNQLSGAFPSLADLSNLQDLFLDSNNFTSIPPGFFEGLTSLQTLSIGSNPNLPSWELPLHLRDFAGLVTFSANECNIAGSIPDVFDSLPSLQNLRLSYNNLTGPLPLSMAKSGIQNLWVNNQQIGLTGTIDVLSSMTALTQVWLHKNLFTGSIPDLSKCEGIFDLQLRDNQLTGLVPRSLVSLPNLRNVSLSNNKLQGPSPVFPPSVAKVTNDGANNFCAAPGVACDPQVMVLLAVAGALGYPASLADKWKGNNACNWNSVACDVKKNVISVSLMKQKFVGSISPAFGNLTSLKSLRLNDNALWGHIPDSLAKLPLLQELDVSGNNLSGKVPQFPASVKLVTKPGNPFLGTDVDTAPPAGTGTGTETGTGTGGTPGSSDQTGTSPTAGGNTRSGSKISGGAIAGIFIAIVIFIAILAFVLFKYMKREKYTMADKGDSGKAVVINGFTPGSSGKEGKHGEGGSDSGERMFEGGNVAVSIEVLRQVTNNFDKSQIIGKGGFGVVYKGVLHDGTMVAIKRMESAGMGTKGLAEFQAEIGVLTKVRHRHLVALLGYCVNGSERFLVYEYMPQGTLGQHLFENQDLGKPPLSWKQRVTIALDVARGVEYLHSLAQQSFIHRDLKPSNILLGDDMRAKVADFGLVKNAPDGKYSVETRLAGTFGYLAPEYAATGRVTRKVDVYAFGVVLMEMITGRKALDDNEPDEMAQLVVRFRRTLINKDNLVKAIDQNLNPDEETLASIHTVAELAGHCTAREPHQRPEMGHAVNVLAPLVEQWRPTTSNEQEEDYGWDPHMSLPQALQKWQSEEGSTTTFGDASFSHTQSSIPSKPPGFADTFNSNDCR